MIATKKVVVLTGAGISAESGIATFRDNNGLWENHRFEDVATYEAFKHNPLLVHRFYNQRRRQLLGPEVAPNSAHIALAKLEDSLGDNLLIVTQNVDNLHERAGSKNVLHMHGELLKARCIECGTTHQWHNDINVDDVCPACGATATLRPDIVWFGEVPFHMDTIYARLSEADIFVAVGTSGVVYPAAGLVSTARQFGLTTVEINNVCTYNADFDRFIEGNASRVVPLYINELLAFLG